MKPEDLQKIWKSQTINPKDHHMLLAEVQKEYRKMERALFWRDMREAAASFLAAFLFFYGGIQQGTNGWPLDLIGLICLVLGLFFVIDRIRQKQKEQKFDQSIRGRTELSLAQVEHQIQLLRNVA